MDDVPNNSATSTPSATSFSGGLSTDTVHPLPSWVADDQATSSQAGPTDPDPAFPVSGSPEPVFPPDPLGVQTASVGEDRPPAPFASGSIDTSEAADDPASYEEPVVSHSYNSPLPVTNPFPASPPTDPYTSPVYANNTGGGASFEPAYPAYGSQPPQAEFTPPLGSSGTVPPSVAFPDSIAAAQGVTPLPAAPVGTQYPTTDTPLTSAPPPSFTQQIPMPSGEGDMAVSLESSGSGWGKKILLILLMLLLLGGMGFFVYQYFWSGQGSNTTTTSTSDDNDSDQTQGTNEPITLTYWGLWEPTPVMQDIISQYQQQYPHVTIAYQQQSHKDYRERLQSALASGQGPDIFRFHNTWVPMLQTVLAPNTSGTLDMSAYFPIVSQDLVRGASVYGVPLDFDTLALYYNPEMLAKAGQSVPQTWEALRNVAKELTVYHTNGDIQVAGVGLGTTNNIDHFSDIVGLMLLQNGADPSNPSTKLTEDALFFYTLFATDDRVWDSTLPNTTYAFATGKVAMILAPSWRAFEIVDINPTLEFATAPVPQLPGEKIAWATYWAEGVAAKSTHSQEAWRFLEFLSQDSNLTKLYTAQSQVRMFGEPYPKINLATQIENAPIVGAFVKQGSYAKSWYLASKTFDNGINDRLSKYYEDAINRVLAGDTPNLVTPMLSQGVAQVLNQYGVSTGGPEGQYVVDSDEVKTTDPAGETDQPPLGPEEFEVLDEI